MLVSVTREIKTSSDFLRCARPCRLSLRQESAIGSVDSSPCFAFVQRFVTKKMQVIQWMSLAEIQMKPFRDLDGSLGCARSSKNMAILLLLFKRPSSLGAVIRRK